MKRRRVDIRITAHHGWALLWIGIGAWDAFAPETLSDGFARLPRQVRIFGAGLVLAHLFDLLPWWCDPIAMVGHYVRPTRLRVSIEESRG